jgi:radical SAM protein with 4Fe4S-binding SPASM domain
LHLNSGLGAKEEDCRNDEDCCTEEIYTELCTDQSHISHHVPGTLEPPACLECDYLRICNGECPKNRFVKAPDGEPGLNYLCEGYRAFFAHADRPMKIMADLIRRGRPAGEIMRVMGKGKDAMRKHP